MQLEGKNVILVGGFGGIGEKCAEAFLLRNVKSIIIFDLIANETYLKYLQETYKNAYVDYIHVDLTRSETIKAAYAEAKEKFGLFDVVINAAGVIDETKIDQLVQINLTGLIHSSLIAMENMSKAKGGNGGCILNISSTAGLNPEELFCIYSASKCGVLNITRSLAHPLYFDKTGVRFINICPGPTATPIINQVVKCFSNQYFDGLKDFMETIDKQTPEAFAKNLVEVVETAANGTTWILQNDTIEQLEFDVVYGPVIPK